MTEITFTAKSADIIRYSNFEITPQKKSRLSLSNEALI